MGKNCRLAAAYNMLHHALMGWLCLPASIDLSPEFKILPIRTVKLETARKLETKTSFYGRNFETPRWHLHPPPPVMAETMVEESKSFATKAFPPFAGDLHPNHNMLQL